MIVPTAMSNSIPVLIVGAGPSGLYLALALLKNGISVRIIEQDRAFHNGSRGVGVQPRTFEMMQLLGLSDDAMRHAYDFPKMRAYKPGLPGEANVLKTWNFVDTLKPTSSIPYGTARMIQQSVHEAIIRDHLKQFSCEVELGMELVGLEQVQDSVVAQVRRHGEDNITHEETIQASYLVGADGARGAVRKLLKLSFIGETHDADAMIVADVEAKNLSSDYLHLWEELKDGDSKSHRNNMVLVRPFYPHVPHNTSFNLVITGSYSTEEMQKIAAEPEVLQNTFHAITGRTDVKLNAVPWVSYFRPNMRMVDKFGEGRVFVVGDSAHVHSPAGGQGLNSSVQDSLNLAWKFSLVLKKLAAPSLLETFTEERLPVIAQMLRKTTGMHASAVKEEKDKVRGEGNKDVEEIGAWRRGGVAAIVLEERKNFQMTIDEMKAHAYGGHGDGICAGDRAPEAPGLLVVSRASEHGEETSLFKLINAAKHSIFIFATSSDSTILRNVIEGPLRAVATLSAAKATIQTFIVSGSSPSGIVSKIFEEKVDALIVDRDGHMHDAYLVKEGEFTVVIIRPDGYVGAITQDKKGVEKYFDKIFH